MSGRKHDAYTLWMKFKNTGWVPRMTVKEPAGGHGVNPRMVIRNWVRSQTSGNDYWQQGKTWMIKPEGQEPE